MGQSLPFDTIRRIEKQAEPGPQPPVTIWSYHAEKVTIQERLAPVLSYFSSRTFSTFEKFDLKPMHFSGMAAAASVLTVFSLFMPSALAMNQPKISVARAASQGTSEDLQRVNGSAIVDFRGMDLLGLKPLTIESKPMTAKAAPKIVLRGGFEPVYAQAGQKYGIPWQILAAVHYVETGQSGDTDAISKAGALGPMQFMPGTFDAYAQDGNGDGVTSVYDVRDAIFTAGKMLSANEAKAGTIEQALYNYNHSVGYVQGVMNYARGLGYNQ